MAQVADHLSVLALEQQYRSCPDATASRHLQTIWLLVKGHHIAEVSATVSSARRWVEQRWSRLSGQFGGVAKVVSGIVRPPIWSCP